MDRKEGDEKYVFDLGKLVRGHIVVVGELVRNKEEYELGEDDGEEETMMDVGSCLLENADLHLESTFVNVLYGVRNCDAELNAEALCELAYLTISFEVLVEWVLKLAHVVRL